jgi:cell division protein FtsL
MKNNKNNFFDSRTALQSESFRIRLNTLSPLLRKRFSKLTHIERIFYGTVAVAALFLALSLVFVRMRILQFQSSTNEMRIEMTDTQTQIDQYQQKLNDLTSNGKAGQSATTGGLNQDSNNVLKASK